MSQVRRKRVETETATEYVASEMSKPKLADLLASAPTITPDAKADLFREILLFNGKYNAWLTKVREVAGA